MEYNFDKVINRMNGNSRKWDFELLEGETKEDVYPMTVADMEFDNFEFLKEKIIERVEQGVFGYEILGKEYFEAVRFWLKKKHDFEVKNDDIIDNSNAIVSLSIAIQTFSEVGDEVIIHSPGYANFFETTNLLKRNILECPLKLVENDYNVDFELMEKKVTSKTKIMIFCNPQNPTGTVWKREDLEKLCKFAKKHNILIIADELHYDFIFNNKKHTMLHKVANEVECNCITLISPGKTFNVSGLKTASVIITDKKLRDKYESTKMNLRFHASNIFAEVVTTSVYSEEGIEWFNQVHDYIDENRKIFIKYFKENLPKLKINNTDATFLMWVDFSGLNLNEKELEELIRKELKIILIDGKVFGTGYEQFRRFNIAVPREKLLMVLERLKKSIS